MIAARRSLKRGRARMMRLCAALEPSAGVVLCILAGVILAEIIASGWAHTPGWQ